MIAETYMVSASAIHEIMGRANMGSVTDRQAKTIADYQSREKLTDNQSEELKRLVAKRDAPAELPEGAKAHCIAWLKSKIYDRKKSFSSVQTDKGNMVEDDAIKLIGKFIGDPFLTKEKEAYADDGFIKTRGCDCLQWDAVGDNKSSWDHDTFPLFKKAPEKKYIYQVNGYASIFNRPKMWIAYTLMDAPDKIVENLTQWECRDLGIPFDMDVFNRIKAHYTYSDYAIELRVKMFHLTRDDAMIKAIHDRVKLCRTFLATLERQLIETGEIKETKIQTLSTEDKKEVS